MKHFKSTSVLLIMMTFFSSCSSAQKLEKKAPLNYDEPYCQKWAAGIKDGGSGVNLFIPTLSDLPENVQLDSVYFRRKSALLEKIEGEKVVYVGRFKTHFNQKQDIIMSSDSKEEYVNQVPMLEEKIPFELKDSECVVSYREDNETKYFKIESIIEKQPQNYPSSTNRQE